MKAYLGIDIGTFESKGVLVDETGRMLASAARTSASLIARRMIAALVSLQRPAGRLQP